MFRVSLWGYFTYFILGRWWWWDLTNSSRRLQTCFFVEMIKKALTYWPFSNLLAESCRAGQVCIVFGQDSRLQNCLCFQGNLIYALFPIMCFSNGFSASRKAKKTCFPRNQRSLQSMSAAKLERIIILRKGIAAMVICAIALENRHVQPFKWCHRWHQESFGFKNVPSAAPRQLSLTMESTFFAHFGGRLFSCVVPPFRGDRREHGDGSTHVFLFACFALW